MDDQHKYALPRWAAATTGLAMLAMATAGAGIGALINVEYALPSGALMVAAFGMAELGEWLIPICCGVIGWNMQMRASLLVCFLVSVWCIGNHLADMQAGTLIAHERSARAYTSAAADEDRARADADRARSTLTRITETGDATALEMQAVEAKARADREAARGGCGNACETAKMEYTAILARLGNAKARDTAKADLAAAEGKLRAAKTDEKSAGPANVPGVAIVLNAVYGVDQNEAARGLSFVRAVLGVLLVKIITYLTVPAMRLLRAAARRQALERASAVQPAAAKAPRAHRSTRPAMVTAAGGAAPRKHKQTPADPVTAFLEARTRKADGAAVASSELHSAYTAWARTQRTEVLSQIAFGRRMSELGYVSAKRGKAGTKHYTDLELSAPALMVVSH